ncbi:hypothetical protein KY290_001320 [Solanum tuberosum]|uniref:Mutator-like transposase n=1 Tax=Solanum tuberosum TaxID=4113 RepID=A0ABQ7WLT6_SOLTU|nr:hypothetical protein KY290_001320 [Solanum tuberosum]
MAVVEFVVAGGDYMGVWEETLKSWNWKSFSKMTVPILLHRNGSYDNMIASIIEADIGGIDGSRPTLRINVNVRPPIEPTNSFNDDNDSIGNERLGDHAKESLVDAEDPERKCCEEMQGERELRSQSNHSFSDGTNLCINQTFTNKNEFQLLLVKAAAKKSIDFATLRSCTKYLKSKLLEMLEGRCGCQVNGLRDSGERIFMLTGICVNGIVNVYNHVHHGYCMRQLGENLRVNNHCGDYLYLKYNAAKAYSLEEFNNHFVEFKNKFPTTVVVLEYDIDFEKWRREHFPSNRYDVMTTNIIELLNAMFIDKREYLVASIINSIAKRFGELFRERYAYILKSMGKTFRRGSVETAERNAEQRHSRREYDLIKILCAHAITALQSMHGNEYEEVLNVNILPPLVKIKFERKRRKRVKGVSENFKSKIRNKCSICKRTGHKRTTCVNNNKS